ncbi:MULTISPECIES: hypothetical protein [unclassified Caballeronia]|uniref:hypothetical protein n=1 Tax=unclassified Caballeronia TaxID=2646786 RepID=UPI00202833F8|nr:MULTISPECIES: hypothetical protein [unclassified Caballeronia]MDR5785041.1 hypothetical protein [Caballeronia sp. LP003]
MSQKATKNDCLAEIKRFFRHYSRFCESPDPDVVREVLASAYSVNDKLRKAGYPNFFKMEEFVAIKTIRNYAIHQAEIYNVTQSLPLASLIPIEAELGILCLIPIDTVNNILEGAVPESIDAIKNTCIFYRDYADIYPAIFNFGVKLFLYTEKHNLEVDTTEYENVAASIKFERENNYPHHVTGGIKLPPGHDIDEFLKQGLHAMEDRAVLQKLFYSEKDGMFTLNKKSH